jgi:uncharacterized membrane protein YphA (DoxX/SURF4 family)
MLAIKQQSKRNASFIVLRTSIGIVYLWFGVLKFFHGVSPAEELAAQTIHKITFGLISDSVNLRMLATWECALGICFIAGKYIKPVLVMMFLHMLFTFTPFIFFPGITFQQAPIVPTLAGQYIIKNIIIISAGIVLWMQENEAEQPVSETK